MKKLLVYIHSDGWRNALRLVERAVAHLFYYRSETNFYCLSKSNDCTLAQCRAGLAIREIGIDEVKAMDFPRLQLLDCDGWMKNGSRLYVSFWNDRPVGFAWTHINRYKIHGVGEFRLHGEEYWSGPMFVHKSVRGRGINKAQIAFQLDQLPLGARMYTSVGKWNVPSIRSYLQFKFEQIGHVSISAILGKRDVVVIGKALKERILLA